MSLSIRKAELKDINSLCSLMKEISGQAVSTKQMLNRLESIEASTIDSLFVCEENRDILGLLGFRIRENLEEVSRFAEVSAIVVHNNNRGKGIGRFLMDHAEKLAKELGCKGMWLVSGFGREEKAHEFYKQLGYQTTGYRFVKLFQ
ncbi:GNAT family N-acetyltransferase [Chloroflexota bacterium]